MAHRGLGGRRQIGGTTETMTNQRHLPWDACFNIRDLGGYAAAAGRRTRWRALLRGDNLGWLKPSGRAALIDYGVRTIIDLRHPSEVARAPHPFAAGPRRRGD